MVRVKPCILFEKPCMVSEKGGKLFQKPCKVLGKGGEVFRKPCKVPATKSHLFSESSHPTPAANASSGRSGKKFDSEPI
jgi:hypothetical protein